MQKGIKLKEIIIIILLILFMILVIGPQLGCSIEATNDNIVSTDTKVNEAEEENDIIEETTQEAITSNSGISNVTWDIQTPQVSFDLKYDKYLLTYTYILIQNSSVHVRKGPSISEPVIKSVSRNEKLNYIETIYNDAVWYHVTWFEKNQRMFGFVNSEVVTKRVFQFDKMHAAIKDVEDEFTKGTLTFINNYNNWKGMPPAYHGGYLDKYGNRRSQSAPGYPNPANQNEFTYIGDGSIVRIISSGDNYTKVFLINDGKEYFVPNKYVHTPPPIKGIKKAIVVDRENQNEAVFEKRGNVWKVISYSLATTGKVGQYHQPTPLGYYYGIEKRERFYYYKDGTTTIQGYAPYAVRFAGGAYVHGIGVDYRFNEAGTRIDTGRIEYSRTIGTVPLSHKCVRNYTSHAKFIYDWYTPGETIIVVIE